MSGDLPPAEVRAALHRTADMIADYLDQVGEYPVLPKVRPGEVAARLPLAPPLEAVSLDEILDDYKALIEPNVTHWNHPGFLAYQGWGRGVETSDIEALERISTGRLKPDRTLLFDLPLEIARERVSSPARVSRADGIDRLDVERLDFYARVRAGYLEMAASEPQRFRIVDSSGKLESTERCVRFELADLLGEEL